MSIDTQTDDDLGDHRGHRVDRERSAKRKESIIVTEAQHDWEEGPRVDKSDATIVTEPGPTDWVCRQCGLTFEDADAAEQHARETYETNTDAE